MTNNNFSISITTTLIVAFAAGICGGIIGYNYSFNVTDPNYLYTMSPRPQSIEKTNEQKIESKKLTAGDVENIISPSILDIYLKKNKINKDELINYNRSDRLAFAVALTTDGWLIAPRLDIKDIVLFDKDKNAAIPEKIINDEVLGLTYIKIKAKNLKPAEFAESEYYTSGQELFLVSNLFSNKLEVASVYYNSVTYPKNKKYTSLSSDSLEKSIIVYPYLATISTSDLMFTNDGKLFGICTNKSQCYKVDYFSNRLAELISQNKISRVKLGLNYIDISTVQQFNSIIGIESQKLSSLKGGALILNDKKQIGQNPQNHLQKNDIIISINNENLDQNKSLSDLLIEYKPGTKVKMTILRSNNLIDLNITF